VNVSSNVRESSCDVTPIGCGPVRKCTTWPTAEHKLGAAAESSPASGDSSRANTRGPELVPREHAALLGRSLPLRYPAVLAGFVVGGYPPPPQTFAWDEPRPALLRAADTGAPGRSGPPLD
jgi:hypothetical protein